MTGQLVAVKELSLGEIMSAEQYEAAINEIRLMRTFHHPRLVHYYGVMENGRPLAAGDGHQQQRQLCGTLQIIMEYVSGGSIGRVIRRFGALQERVAARYTMQVLQGLRYLHDECAVCHRDIKPDNVFITPDGRCKLGDFGISRSVAGGSLLNTCAGTPCYMAPEVVSQEGYTTSADVWSVGCFLFEMLAGAPPYADLSNPVAVMFAIANATEPPTLPPQVRATITQECHDFLCACLTRDPKSRPAVRELLVHPWLDGVDGAVNPHSMNLSDIAIAKEEDGLSTGGRTPEAWSTRLNNNGQYDHPASCEMASNCPGRRGEAGSGSNDYMFTIPLPSQQDEAPAPLGEPVAPGGIFGGLSDDATGEIAIQGKYDPGHDTDTGQEGHISGSLHGTPIETASNHLPEWPMPRCQRCHLTLALFECDDCRRMPSVSFASQHQLCLTCWGIVHRHSDRRHHVRRPLLCSDQPTKQFDDANKPNVRARPAYTASNFVLENGDLVEFELSY